MKVNKDWSQETVVVIGAARQGVALARFLLDQGAIVRLTDMRSYSELVEAREVLAQYSNNSRLQWFCGSHPMELLDQATLVCPSGGVSLKIPLLLEAKRRAILLSNDSQIFLDSAPCKVIGITGSAGKTTTTTLVGRIAQKAIELPGFHKYHTVWVGGNIGSPLISMLSGMGSKDLVVMELSSFQLEIMKSSPQISAILNVTPNHLDRHESMELYTRAKSVILDYQSDFDTAVLGRDDPIAWSLAKRVRGSLMSFGMAESNLGGQGSFLDRNNIILRKTGANGNLYDHEVMAREAIDLRGDHNLLNVMAACTIADAADIPLEAMQAGVRGFKGVPHRLEFIRSWGGADWYNDSIATAPERSIAAIRSFHEPLVLLAGGRDKNLPWDEFANLAQQRVDHLILFGEAVEIIDRSLKLTPGTKLQVTRCKSLREAVFCAAEVVRPGDVVLLSPGGTSFDEFIDFEERGKCFAQWVKKLP